MKFDFNNLPVEIKLEIAKHLKMRELCLLERTSKANKSVFGGNAAWQRFIQKTEDIKPNTYKKIATSFQQELFSIISRYLFHPPRALHPTKSKAEIKFTHIFCNLKETAFRIFLDSRNNNVAELVFKYIHNTPQLEKHEFAEFLISLFRKNHRIPPPLNSFRASHIDERDLCLSDIYVDLFNLLLRSFDISNESIYAAAKDSNIQVSSGHINIGFVVCNILESKLASSNANLNRIS